VSENGSNPAAAVMMVWYSVMMLDASTKLLYIGPSSTRMVCYHLHTGKPPRYVTSHRWELSLIPSVRPEMSNCQVVMLRGWE